MKIIALIISLIGVCSVLLLAFLFKTAVDESARAFILVSLLPFALLGLLGPMLYATTELKAKLKNK